MSFKGYNYWGDSDATPLKNM